LGSRSVPFSGWKANSVPSSILGAAALHHLEERARLEPLGDGSVLIDFDAAASLGNAEAAGLGFPPTVPFQLSIKSQGIIGDADFRANWSFVRGGVRVPVRVVGSAVFHGSDVYRLPEPLYSIIGAAEDIARALRVRLRIRQWAMRRRRRLPRATWIMASETSMRLS
jgi:hypothetical protein